MPPLPSVSFDPFLPMTEILIVGSGLGGYTLARELRKLLPESPLRMITSDGGEFYAKPKLSNGFALGGDAEVLISKSAGDMAETLKMAIDVRTSVTSIDCAGFRLEADGRDLPWSALILALGASQRRLAFSGDAEDEVMTVNSLDDYRHFLRRVAHLRELVLIGSGLIGCEFANDLLNVGKSVQLVAPDDWPLQSLVPEEVGRCLQRQLSSLGAVWHLGTTVASIDRDEDKLSFGLANGERIVADAALSAAGLVPNTTLALEAGIECGSGLITDAALATSTEGVYAIGDCAEIDGLVQPYVMPIMHSARALAATLAGTSTAVHFPVMPVIVKTPACPVSVVVPPKLEGSWEVSGDESGMKALFRTPMGRLEGFAVAGAANAEKRALVEEMAAQ